MLDFMFVSDETDKKYEFLILNLAGDFIENYSIDDTKLTYVNCWTINFILNYYLEL